MFFVSRASFAKLSLRFMQEVALLVLLVVSTTTSPKIKHVSSSTSPKIKQTLSSFITNITKFQTHFITNITKDQTRFIINITKEQTQLIIFHHQHHQKSDLVHQQHHHRQCISSSSPPPHPPTPPPPPPPLTPALEAGNMKASGALNSLKSPITCGKNPEKPKNMHLAWGRVRLREHKQQWLAQPFAVKLKRALVDQAAANKQNEMKASNIKPRSLHNRRKLASASRPAYPQHARHPNLVGMAPDWHKGSG